MNILEAPKGQFELSIPQKILKTQLRKRANTRSIMDESHTFIPPSDSQKYDYTKPVLCKDVHQTAKLRLSAL